MTPEERRMAWGCFIAGSLLVIVGTSQIQSIWHAVVAAGTSLITAAAGLGIAALRPTTGGR